MKRAQTGATFSVVPNSSLPLPLRAVAAAIKQDGGQSTGRAVLFAASVNLDLFERHIPDLAVATSVTQTRLQQIVDVARTALDDTSPRVPGQHVVSKVLLRQFTIPPRMVSGCWRIRSDTARPSFVRRKGSASSKTS